MKIDAMDKPTTSDTSDDKSEPDDTCEPDDNNYKRNMCIHKNSGRDKVSILYQ